MTKTAAQTLTMRSKIAIRYTTAPGDLGYDGPKTGWEKSKPTMRSLRTALSFEAELNQRIGNGVFRRVSYQHKGLPVTRQDIFMAHTILTMPD